MPRKTVSGSGTPRKPTKNRLKVERLDIKISQMSNQLDDIGKKLDVVLNILLYRPENGIEYIKAKERFICNAKILKKNK